MSGGGGWNHCTADVQSEIDPQARIRPNDSGIGIGTGIQRARAEGNKIRELGHPFLGGFTGQAEGTTPLSNTHQGCSAAQGQ